MGLYEVVYKMALPEEPGVQDSSIDEEEYDALLPIHPTVVADLTPPESRPESPYDPPARHTYPSILRADQRDIPLHPRIDRQTSRTPLLRIKTPPSPPLSSDVTPLEMSPIGSPTTLRRIHQPPPDLPVALHSNFLTSCIGLATLVLLWIPMPILHYVGWETFRWPGQEGESLWAVWSSLEIVAWGGAVYVS